MHRIECVITGKVQGVFFREFAKRHADLLGITGFAENREDGGVFVIAEGEKTTLEDFISRLKEGSEHANVTNVSVVWEEAIGGNTLFSIS
ncbi:MAG: acylphosphatase, partial [Patescibacteria group bacterium]